jgi:hypothetical protein
MSLALIASKIVDAASGRLNVTENFERSGNGYIMRIGRRRYYIANSDESLIHHDGDMMTVWFGKRELLRTTGIQEIINTIVEHYDDLEQKRIGAYARRGDLRPHLLNELVKRSPYAAIDTAGNVQVRADQHSITIGVGESIDQIVVVSSMPIRETVNIRANDPNFDPDTHLCHVVDGIIAAINNCYAEIYLASSQ